MDRRNVVVYELQGRGCSSPAAITRIRLPGTRCTCRVLRAGRTRPGRRNRPHASSAASSSPASCCILRKSKRARNLLLTERRAHTVAATIRNPPVLVPAFAKPGQFCHLAIPLAFEGSLTLAAASSFLLGNVAPASHGETVASEIVGNGDASATFQKFLCVRSRSRTCPQLRPKASPARCSCLWMASAGAKPRSSSASPTARVYELLPKPTMVPLPCSSAMVAWAPWSPPAASNVVATYRVGSGLAGRVAANSLTTLLAKPAGLSAAINPLAAEGGADAETLERARDNAPRTVRTFGRIVSLRDFEDQVTVSGEVAKAIATLIYDGLDRAVHLTIAGQEGALFSEQALRELG